MTINDDLLADADLVPLRNNLSLDDARLITNLAAALRAIQAELDTRDTADQHGGDQERLACPDDGTCHHRCWRVDNAGPLSGVFPDDERPGPESDSPAGNDLVADPLDALSVYTHMRADGCSDRIDLGVVIEVLLARDALVDERATTGHVLFDGTQRELYEHLTSRHAHLRAHWSDRVRLVAAGDDEPTSGR